MLETCNTMQYSLLGAVLFSETVAYSSLFHYSIFRPFPQSPPVLDPLETSAFL